MDVSDLNWGLKGEFDEFWSWAHSLLLTSQRIVESSGTLSIYNTIRLYLLKLQLHGTLTYNIEKRGVHFIAYRGVRRCWI